MMYDQATLERMFNGEVDMLKQSIERLEAFFVYRKAKEKKTWAAWRHYAAEICNDAQREMETVQYLLRKMNFTLEILNDGREDENDEDWLHGGRCIECYEELEGEEIEKKICAYCEKDFLKGNEHAAV